MSNKPASEVGQDMVALLIASETFGEDELHELMENTIEDWDDALEIIAGLFGLVQGLVEGGGASMSDLTTNMGMQLAEHPELLDRTKTED